MKNKVEKKDGKFIRETAKRLGISESAVEKLLQPVDKDLTNNYNNSKGDEKMKMRDLSIDAIIESGIYDGDLYSLSHEDTIFEERLNERIKGHNFNITCHEIDKKVFNNLCVKTGIKGLGFNLSNESILKPIKNAKEGSISHLNLDFCGQFDNPKIVEIVTIAMQNKVLTLNGVLTLTVNNRSNKGAIKNGVIKEMLHIIKKGNNDKLVETCITNYLLSIGNLNYSIEAKPYHDISEENGKTKGNMLLYIIKRIR